MDTLTESHRSAKALGISLHKMIDALNRPYDPYPDDPSQNLMASAQNCLLFLRATLSDLMRSDDIDLRGSGAVRLAIELGELEMFEDLFSQELEDIKANNPDDLKNFIDQMHDCVDEKHTKEEWLALISKVSSF